MTDLAHHQSTQTVPALVTAALIDELLAHGCVEAWVFGSVARGEETPESDIDLLARFEPTLDFAERFRLTETLAQIAGRPVDLVLNLHPAFERYVLPDQIRIIP